MEQSFLPVSQVKTIFDQLAQEYQKLIDTRNNLESDCKKLQEYIDSQIVQLKNLNEDFEKLKDEYVKHKNDASDGAAPDQAEPTTEELEQNWHVETLVNPSSIPHPISISLLAEIVDVSVICSVAFSPNDKYLAFGSNKILRVYDIEPDNFIYQYTFEDDQDQKSNHLRSLAWTQDNNNIICAAEDGNIYVFDLKEKVKSFQASTGEVFQIQISHNGKFLATVSADGALQLFNMKNYEKIATMVRDDTPSDSQSKVASSLSISEDDKIIAVGYCDNHVALWDVESRQMLWKDKIHSKSVYSVKFIPHSDRLATSSLDSSIKIWDIKKDESGKPYLELWKILEGHSDFILSLDVDPTGEWLLSGSKDLTAKLSSLTTGEMTYNIKTHSNSIITVAFNHSGKVFSTGSGDQAVKIWTVMPLKPENE